MKAEARFHQLLAALSRQCGRDLDVIEVELYDRHLSSYGYDRLNQCLERLLVERNERDPFPSIAMIRRTIDPELDPQSRAQLIADRIWGLIARRGYVWTMTAVDFNGELEREAGREAVVAVQNLGGWRRVCEDANATDPGIMKAQIRKSCEAASSMLRAGHGNVREAITASSQIAALANGALKRLPGAS